LKFFKEVHGDNFNADEFDIGILSKGKIEKPNRQELGLF